MAGETQVTTDHQKIKQWAEERGGEPATVKGTGVNGKPGILQIHFPEHGADESLQEISWDAFFAKFEQEHLAFLYQENLHSGEISRFHRFVERRGRPKRGSQALGEGDLDAAQQALYRVMQIEDQANQHISDAQDQARQIIDDAKKQADKTVEAARSDAQDKARGVQKEAESAAAEEAKGLMQEAESDIDRLRSAAQRNMDQAVSLLVHWVAGGQEGDG